jgi:ribulose-phosphate 3-epimerase
VVSTRNDRLGRLHDRRRRICPSLLNCDFGILAEEIADAERCGTDIVHWDVMDGDFCPNFTYGPPLVKSLRRSSDAIFDVHLMMQTPDKYLDQFVDAGADIITVHAEALPDPVPVLRAIRSAGCLAGLAINPPTGLEPALALADDLDMLLVMSVMPGFGGQSFDASVLPKIKRFRELKPDVLVEIDGGINQTTIARAAQAGVSLFVVGSAFYNADNRASVFDELRRQIDVGN